MKIEKVLYRATEAGGGLMRFLFSSFALLFAAAWTAPIQAEPENGGVIVAPEPEAEGSGLTSQEIMKVIRSNLNQIRHCYETLLIRKPQAEGKVQTHFQISAKNGKVVTVTHESAKLDDAKFLGCIDDRIKKWKFPKPRGSKDVEVDYPFTFKPT